MPDMHHQVFLAEPVQRGAKLVLAVRLRKLPEQRRLLPHGAASAVQLRFCAVQRIDGVPGNFPHIVNVDGRAVVVHIEPLEIPAVVDPVRDDLLHLAVAFALEPHVPAKMALRPIDRLEDIRRPPDKFLVRVGKGIGLGGLQHQPVFFRVLRVFAVSLVHDMDQLVRRRQVHDLRQELRQLG